MSYESQPQIWPYFIIDNSAFIIALLLEMPIVVAGVGLSELVPVIGCEEK